MNSRTAFRRKPKFTVGEFVTDPQQVVAAVKSGKWLYFGTADSARVYAASWILNMNFGCVMSYVAQKQLAFAHRNSEYPYVWTAKWWPREAHDYTHANPGLWEARCSEVPGRTIEAPTKDVLAVECEKAVIEHTGRRSPRVQVRFEMPQAPEPPPPPMPPTVGQIAFLKKNKVSPLPTTRTAACDAINEVLNKFRAKLNPA